MLTQALKKEIQQAYSQLLNNKSLKPRSGQKQMIAHIAKCLSKVERGSDDERINDAGICAIEAGTGTGKTVAYTLAVLPLAKALGKKVVISTATVALQEQIIYRDLPDIKKHSGLNFRFALAKGRGRYLCLSRLDNLMNIQGQNDIFAGTEHEVEDEEAETVPLYESMAKALLTSQWDGDKDSWEDELTAEQWQPLTTDRNQCSGRRCQHVAQCSFIKSRENLAQVDCIVANHDLVMADLALGGGAILSKPDDTIYIFDEAHHLADIALRHFTAQLRLHGAVSWVDQSIKTLGDIGKNYSVFIHLLNKLDRLPGQLLQLKTLYQALKPILERCCEPVMESLGGQQNLPHYRFEQGELPDDLVELAKTCSKELTQVVDDLTDAHECIDEALEKNDSGLNASQLDVLYGEVGQMLSVAEKHLALFEAYSQPVREIPDSRWVQLVESGGYIDFELNSSPLLASGTLKYYLWSRCFSAVLTSATLTALGQFNRLKMHTGLPDFAECYVVQSPFNYQQNAQFVVPKMQYDGSQHDAHSEEIAKLLPELLGNYKGILVLFSSKRQLQDVYQLLPADVQDDILRQSDMSKQQLLQMHCEQVDKNQRSILFGLASLAEGIDLPGEYCSHVIIAKLPFAPPNDPVAEALSEWFQSVNRNAFMEIALPDVSQRLIQACGRLIRTERDVGRITLMDKRIVTKRYGSQLLNSLPPFQRYLEG